MTQGSSNSLFAVVNVSTADLQKQVDDFSLSKQINISYISQYNQTLLKQVNDNQGIFQNLNASSFILPDGVVSGMNALASISNQAACGSRTYTTSNVSECLKTCQPSLIAACRTAVAYSLVVLHSQQLGLANSMVLTNISAMNSTVSVIVPTINQADVLLKQSITSLTSGFKGFDNCGWIGKSFVTIRSNLCGNVADTINVMWLCCGVLATVLMYLPFIFVKAEKRFKRINLDKEKQAHDQKYAPAQHNHQQSPSEAPPHNSSGASADGVMAFASAPRDSGANFVSVGIPQNM